MYFKIIKIDLDKEVLAEIIFNNQKTFLFVRKNISKDEYKFVCLSLKEYLKNNRSNDLIIKSSDFKKEM